MRRALARPQHDLRAKRDRQHQWINDIPKLPKGPRIYLEPRDEDDIEPEGLAGLDERFLLQKTVILLGLNSAQGWSAGADCVACAKPPEEARQLPISR